MGGWVGWGWPAPAPPPPREVLKQWPAPDVRAACPPYPVATLRVSFVAVPCTRRSCHGVVKDATKPLKRDQLDVCELRLVGSLLLHGLRHHMACVPGMPTVSVAGGPTDRSRAPMAGSAGGQGESAALSPACGSAAMELETGDCMLGDGDPGWGSWNNIEYLKALLAQAQSVLSSVSPAPADPAVLSHLQRFLLCVRGDAMLADMDGARALTGGPLCAGTRGAAGKQEKVRN